MAQYACMADYAIAPASIRPFLVGQCPTGYERLPPRCHRREDHVVKANSILVVAMLLAAAGCAKNDANRDIACTDAKGLRQVAVSYRVLKAKGTCPTVEQLRSSGQLDEGSATKDPWGGSFKIECQGDAVKVTSPGPDGAEKTGDDVVSPDCGSI